MIFFMAEEFSNFHIFDGSIVDSDELLLVIIIVDLSSDFDVCADSIFVYENLVPFLCSDIWN